MKQSKNNGWITRRQLIRTAGVIGLGAVGTSANARITRAQGAPSIARGTTLTVSTWGGVTQDGIKAYAQKEFEKQTGAASASLPWNSGRHMSAQLVGLSLTTSGLWAST